VNRLLASVRQMDRDRLLLVLTAAVAVYAFTAWGAVALITGDPLFTQFTAGYYEIAEDMLRTGRFTTFFRPPLYPLLIASLIRLFGDSWTVGLAAIHTLLWILCAVGIAGIALYTFDNAPAAIAGVALHALNPGFLVETFIVRETVLFTALTIGVIFALTTPNRSRYTIVAAGFLAGLAHLTRPTGILLIAVIVVVTLFDHMRQPIRRRVVDTVLGVAAFAVLAGPWQFGVSHTVGEPVLSSSLTGGLNLYQGNNPAADALSSWVDVDQYYPQVVTLLREHDIDLENGGPSDELAADRFLKKRAMEYIVTHPFRFLHRAIIGTAALYSPFPTPFGSARIVIDGDAIRLEDFHLRNLWLALPIALHALILLGGVIGFYLVLARRALYRRAAIVIGGIAILLTFSHAVTFAEYRFRLPLDPSFALLAAVTYVAIISRTSQTIQADRFGDRHDSVY
jgi:4-amino-4-deoxy-L-arabinose transferase-like glycosyltransferase